MQTIVGSGTLLIAIGAILSGEFLLGIWLIAFVPVENSIISITLKSYSELNLKNIAYPSRTLMFLMAAYFLQRESKNIGATGLAFAAIGVLLNWLVSAANGMRMPVQIKKEEIAESNNYIALDDARFCWLGDWIPISQRILASIGDILQVIGVWTAVAVIWTAWFARVIN